MRTRSKLVLAALVATACLAVAVGTANARRIEFSEQHIRAVWSIERAHFKGSNAAFAIECELTIEGSFHSRTLSKVCGQLIGYITVAEAPNLCIGGEIAILNGVEPLPGGGTAPNTLPWHVRYHSFSGTLPTIERIRIQIIGAAILMWDALIECLYQSTAAKPLFAILHIVAGTLTTLQWDETSPIPLKIELRFPCPAEATLAGSSNTFEVQRRTTRVFVRLVQ
jgi:hypothetical protein